MATAPTAMRVRAGDGEVTMWYVRIQFSPDIELVLKSIVVGYVIGTALGLLGL